jgi:hypothetical protein
VWRDLDEDDGFLLGRWGAAVDGGDSRSGCRGMGRLASGPLALLDGGAYPGPMAWRIVATIGALVGVTLIGGAVLTHPIGESRQAWHWYLLASGFGVLLVSAPAAWLAFECTRPTRHARSLGPPIAAMAGCAVAAVLGVLTVAVAEDRSTVTTCFHTSPTRMACSRAIDYTSADTRAFVPLLLALIVLLMTGFVAGGLHSRTSPTSSRE